jgi:hypothetical protein
MINISSHRKFCQQPESQWTKTLAKNNSKLFWSTRSKEKFFKLKSKTNICRWLQEKKGLSDRYQGFQESKKTIFMLLFNIL